MQTYTRATRSSAAACSAAAVTTCLLGGALFGAMIILPLYYQVDRGESALTTWLHRVTVNAALVHRRKRARREGRHAPEQMMDEQTTSAPSGPARRWAAPPDAS